MRPDRFRPGWALLLTVGLAVPVAIGAIKGEVLLGVLGSVGSLYAGLASFGNVHAVRLRRMLLTSVVVAALAFLGSLVAGSTYVTVLTVTGVAFAFSLYGSTSARNSLVGILGTGILLIVSGLPDTRPLITGLAVLAGGLVETALVALAEPLFPRSIERISVASTFFSLADFVDGIADGNLVPDATPFLEARARLEESHSPETDRLNHLLRVAETLRAGLVGFSRATRRISKEHPEQASEIAGVLAYDLRDLARAIEQGRYNVLATLAARPPQVTDERYGRWVRLIVLAFEEAARPPLPDESEPSPRNRAPVPPILRSLTLQHSLRFALAVGGATLIYRVFEIPLGYWVPLTVTFLLRPDYSTTLQKGFARFVGTFGGVVVASVIASLLPQDRYLLAGLSVIGAWFAFALYDVSFTLYIGALTFYVVLGLASRGSPGATIGYDRTVATILGVLIAVVATFLWPVWESGRIGVVLRDAFRAQVIYGEELATLMHGGSVRASEDLRHRARTTRIEAERLAMATQLEPRWARRADPERVREWVGTLGENAAELLTLHAYALEQRAGRVPDDPALRQRLQHAISEARSMAESPVAESSSNPV